MAQMLLAGFDSYKDADMAVTDLEKAGFTSDEISVITAENKDKAGDAMGDMAEGAVGGATTGGVIGGLAGLLAGAGVIPAITGLLIGGPIAAALGATGIAATAISGAVTGAAAGGLIGALTNLGVSESDAEEYETMIKNGGMLLAVSTDTDNQSEAKEILEDHGAHSINSVTTK